MKTKYVLIMCALALSGCAPVDDGKESKQSSAPGLGDTVTQKATIDAGRKAASTLKAIGAQHKGEFEEAVEE